jgi:hypothetical protein
MPTAHSPESAPPPIRPRTCPTCGKPMRLQTAEPNKSFINLHCSLVLQTGQGMPEPPQVQARGPSHGRSSCSSQSHRQSSQRVHFIHAGAPCPRCAERRRDLVLIERDVEREVFLLAAHLASQIERGRGRSCCRDRSADGP